MDISYFNSSSKAIIIKIYNNKHFKISIIQLIKQIIFLIIKSWSKNYFFKQTEFNKC